MSWISSERSTHDLQETKSKVEDVDGQVVSSQANLERVEGCRVDKRAEASRACAQIRDLAEQFDHANSSSSRIQDETAASYPASANVLGTKKSAQLVFALDDVSLQTWLYQEICWVEHMKEQMGAIKKEQAELTDKVTMLELDRKRVADEEALFCVERAETKTLRAENKDLRDQVAVITTEVDNPM